MIKLKIKSKDEYSNYILENNNKTYEVNINIIGTNILEVGNYIYMPEEVLKEKVSLNYGPIEGNDIKEDEVILLMKNNEKIYLQRYYG